MNFFQKPLAKISFKLLILLLWLVQLPELWSQNCFIPANPVVSGITPVQAAVGWDAMPGATAYELNYRPFNAPATLPWTTVSAPANAVTLTGLNPSTLYVAQIRSVCGADFSDFTSSITFSTQNCLPPSAISASNVTLNTADLTWTTPIGVNNFTLLYRIAVTNPGPWSSLPVSGNSYTLTGLNANTLYSVRMLSNCTGSHSDTSEVVYFTTGSCNVPEGLNITAQTASSISLAWNAVGNATQYTVQYRISGSNTWITLNSGTHSRTVSGLTGNTLYEFRVRTVCGGGIASGYTLPITGFTLPCAMPENAMVSNVTVNSAQISWNNAVGAAGYRTEYRVLGVQNWTTVNSTTPTRNLNGLTPDTDYEVRVRTHCGGNQFSAYTTTLNFRTKPCNVPQGFNLVNFNVRNATLSWNSVVGALNYHLECRPSGGNWRTMTVNDTFRVVNLSPDTLYEARVRSRCAAGVHSDYSDIVYIELLPCQTPSGFHADTLSASEAWLAWDTMGLALQYRVEFKKTSEVNWSQRLVAGQSSVRLQNLFPNTAYQARITSGCGQGVWSDVLDTLLFTTGMCEVTGWIHADTVTYDRIKLSWADVAGQNFTVEHRAVGDTLWTGRNTANTTLTYNNLISGMGYFFRVKTRCGTNGSSLLSPTYFVTTRSCDEPLIYDPDTLSATSIRLKWTSDPIDRYTVEYKAQNDTVWQSRNVNDTVTVFNNLVLANNYEFRIRKRCTAELTSGFATYARGGPGGGTQTRCAVRLTVECGKLVLTYGSAINPFPAAGCSMTVRLRNANTGSQQTRTLSVSDFTQSGNTYTSVQSLLQYFTPPTIGPDFVYEVQISFPACGTSPACNTRWFTNLFINRVTLTPSVTTVCSGDRVILSANLDKSIDGAEFRWFGPGLPGSGRVTSVPTLNVNPTVTGTYTVRAYKRGAENSCLEATVTINVTPRPVINTPCPTEQICLGETLSFNVTWTPPVPITDVTFTGTGWTMSSLTPGGATLTLNPTTGGNYTYVLRVGRAPCQGIRICSTRVIDARFNLPVIRECYPAGEAVTIRVPNPRSGSGFPPAGTWTWSNTGSESGVVVDTYDDLVLTVPSLTTTLTYTVNFRLGNTGCITSQQFTLRPCETNCNPACTLNVTLQPETCFPTRIRACAPAYLAGTTYDWKFMPGDRIILTGGINNCITTDVPYDAESLEVTANVSGSGPITFRPPVNSIIYPRGNRNIPANVNTATLLSQNVHGTVQELIDPGANSGAGYPTNVEGTFVFGTLTGNRFVVDRNLTLRNMRLVIGENIQFIVNANARLTLENCYIHSQNPNQTWTGIFVGTVRDITTPGRLIFNNVTMEHSVNGITIPIFNGGIAVQPEPCAGLVWVDNSCLNENRTHIEVTGPARWQSGTNHIAGTPTPLILRNTVLTCIDPLPGTARNFTDVAVSLYRVASVQVGANVITGRVAAQIQRDPLPALPVNFPSEFGWLNPNRITRVNTGIQTQYMDRGVGIVDPRNQAAFINNNRIADLIKENSDVLTAVPTAGIRMGDGGTIALRPNGTPPVPLPYQLEVGTLLTGYNPTLNTGTVSNEFVVDNTIFAPTTPLPALLFPTVSRTDYGILYNGTVDRRLSCGTRLLARNNRFRNITATTGTDAVCGIHAREPQIIAWDIENNRFQDIEYATFVAERIAAAGTGNTYSIKNNCFNRFKCGTVFYSNSIANPVGGPNTTIRGAITVADNRFDEYIDNRGTNPSPHGLPAAFDGGVIVFGPMRPSVQVNDAYPYNRVLAQPRLLIDNNLFVGQQQIAIELLGESAPNPLDINDRTLRARVSRNRIAPNQGYTGRTCKIGIHSAVCAYVDLIDNDVDLGNVNPANNINGVPGAYTNPLSRGAGHIDNGLYSSAFWLSQTKVFDMHCNRIRNGGFGFDVQGDCIPRVEMNNNVMSNLNVGLLLRNLGTGPGIVGQQAILDVNPPFAPVASRDNVWDRNNLTNQTYAWDSDGRLSPFIVSIGNLIPPRTTVPDRNFRGGTGVAIPFTVQFDDPYVHRCTRLTQNEYVYNWKEEAPQEGEGYYTEEQMVKGVYTDGNANRLYDQHQTLMTLLSEKGCNGIYRSTVLDSFYKANLNSTMAGFITVGRLLDVQPETAEQYNDQLVPANVQEKNQQTYYRLYLSAKKNNGKLTAGEYADLVKVAEQCPETGGIAVRQARMMRFNLDLNWHNYPECGTKTEKPIEKSKTAIVNQVSLYPNPAVASVNLSFDLTEESAKVSFTNVLGIQIGEQPLTGKKGILTIDTQKWPAGVYTCKVMNRNGETVAVSKFVVVK